MSLIDLEIIKVNEVINKHDAYEAVGYKLFDRLQIVLDTLANPKLLILDFSELYLLTYGFVEIALKNIVDYTKSNNDLILLFQINKPELEELITGIIDMLELQPLNSEALDEPNLLAKHYSFAYIEDKKTVRYIGVLNDVEKDILQIIEKKGETTHNEIDSQLKLEKKANYCEDIARSVTRLFDSGFIFQIEKNRDIPSHYFSLKYLQSHEN